jgi:hypothetical protein
MLRDDFPEVHVLRGEGNLWFGGAVDLALRHHLLAGALPDYILILNNDTFPDICSVDKMVKWSNGERVVAANFLIEDQGRLGTAGFVWRFPNGLRSVCDLENWENLKKEHPGPTAPVDSVATTFTLYPARSLQGFESINLKRHPHNRYDVLLSAQARKIMELVVSKESLGKHYFGTQVRYRSCRSMSLGEFISYLFSDPKGVAYFPGALQCAYNAAPSPLKAFISSGRYILFVGGQFVVVLASALGRSLRKVVQIA